MPKSRVSGRRVIVVGSSNTDYVVEVSAIPRPGETVLGGSLAIFAGGKGANQAVACARAGAKTVFLGAFGADSNGRERRLELEQDGIDCSSSSSLKGTASGIAMIAVVPATARQRGDNAIVVAPGANQKLDKAQVKRGLSSVTAGDVVLCSLEVPLDCIAEAARIAKSKGATVVLNPAPFPAKGLPDTLLRSVDFVTPNEHEFAALLGGEPGTAAASKGLKALSKRLGAKAPQFIITRGADGVDWFDGETYRPKVATPPKVKAVDTVGAGDCFSGTFAASLALGETRIESALAFAVAASAISVTRPGAQASMPKRSEILGMLKKK